MLSQTSKVVMGIIVDQMEKRDVQGVKEYGVSIDEADDIIYNWQLEAMEEMTDALKYQQKEIAKLKAENIRLKAQPRFKMEEENLRLVEENERLKRDIKTMAFTINKYNHDLTEREKENERLKKDVVDLKEENERMHNFITEQNATICKYTRDLIEYGKENERLKKTVKAWEIAVNDMTNRLSGGK